MSINVVNQGGTKTLDISQNNKPDEAVKNNAIDNKTADTNNKDGVAQEDIKKAVDKLNKMLEGEQVHSEYEIHKGFGDIMIKIVDNKTKEVIKEIPSKKLLDMIEQFCKMAGVIFDKKA